MPRKKGQFKVTISKLPSTPGKMQLLIRPPIWFIRKADEKKISPVELLIEWFDTSRQDESAPERRLREHFRDALVESMKAERSASR